MALCETLKPLFRNPNFSPRFLFSLHASSSPSFPPFPFAAAAAVGRSPSLPWWSSPAGPLFLAHPPWKLLQAARTLQFPGGSGAKVAAQDLLKLRPFPARVGIVGLREVRERAEKVVGVVGNVGADDRILNLPNAVSIGRMASGPVIGWMILNEWYLPAFGALAVSGASDWLDGYLARKMGINSFLGSYLDPLADKVLIGSVALAMVTRGLLHPGLVGLVVLRDVVLIGGVIYERASIMGWKWDRRSDFFNLEAVRPRKVEPLLISKVNTVFQLLLVAATLLQPVFGTDDTQIYNTYLSWLVAATTVASAGAYGLQFLRHRNRPLVSI